MVKARIQLCLLQIIVLFVFRVPAQPDSLTGGSSGNDGNQFLDGTANTAKASFGITCRKSTSSSTDRQIDLYMYQSDTAFDYTAQAPSHLANNYVDYTICYLLDTTVFDSTKEVKKPTVSNACGNSADFTFIDSSGVAASYQTRTMHKTITVDPAATSYPCGAKKNTNNIKIAFYCKRDINFDKDFDYIMIAEHDVVTGDCLIEELKTNIDVNEPPVIEIKRNYIVTFKAYKADSITSLPDEHESPSAKEITAAVDLGQEMYLEACLKIPGGTGTAPANNMFFDDGVAPIGLALYSCTAEPVSTGTTFVDSVSGLKPTVVDANRCGTETDPVKYFSKNKQTFKWFFKSSDGVQAYLRSPNCFRSPPFEAVSFQSRFVTSTVQTKFICQVEYCTSSSNTKCFGDKNGGGDGYPTCPAPTGRRKREVITVGPDYPEQVSVLIDVKLPGSNSTSSSGLFDGCFEKKTFISLTSVLTILLVVVLAVAAYLAYKIQSPDLEDELDSSSGSRTRTLTGSVNKAFF